MSRPFDVTAIEEKWQARWLDEGTYEVEYAAEQWGMRPAEHLGAIGFLSPRVHAAHSILLSAGEIDLYAQHQVSAAHCPLGNFIIGVPKVPEMLRRGIRVGLGTDGAASGSIDLFEAIRVSWVALQSHHGTPWHIRNVTTLEDLLRMATLGGAEALGMEDQVGSIEPGKLADLIVFSKDPLADIHNTNSVKYVMKNGEMFEGATMDEVWPEQKPLAPLWWWKDKPTGSASTVGK